jgi:short chain dehydrogenase
MAYFVVTQGLRERLVASAPARVVNTASAAHQGASLEFDDLQLTESFGAMKAYGRSKLCNILFTRELARRLHGTGVTANCLHPGFVATRFGDESGGLISRFVGLAKLLAISPRSPRQRANISTSAARLRLREKHRTTKLQTCYVVQISTSEVIEKFQTLDRRLQWAKEVAICEFENAKRVMQSIDVLWMEGAQRRLWLAFEGNCLDQLGHRSSSPVTSDPSAIFALLSLVGALSHWQRIGDFRADLARQRMS